MNLTDIIDTVTWLLLIAVSVGGGFILLAFMWNLLGIILSANDPKKRQQAKSRLLWGIIIIFAFVSLAGILVLLRQTLFAGDNFYKSLL